MPQSEQALSHWWSADPNMNDHVWAHLESLGGAEREYVFAAIPEAPGAGGPVKHFRGRFQDIRERLHRAQEQGAGIFVMPNEGKGAKASDVRRAQALFLDFDNGEISIEKRFEPTLRIRTARGFHVYYRIEPSTDLKLWAAIQSGLARQTGADTQCTNANRVMRLAGTWHLKKRPTFVEVNAVSPARIYRLSDFHQYAVREEESHLQALDHRHLRTWDFPLLRRLLNEQISLLRRAVPGQRKATMRNVSWCLGHYIPFGLSAELAENCIFQALSKWNDIKLSVWMREARTNLRKGAQDSIVNPPFIPQSVVEAVRREELQAAWIDQLRLLLLPDVVTVDSVLQSLAWWDTFASSRQASLLVGAELRRLGYVGRREKVCKRAKLVFRRREIDADRLAA
jgi:hypothetical protein